MSVSKIKSSSAIRLNSANSNICRMLHMESFSVKTKCKNQNALNSEAS